MNTTALSLAAASATSRRVASHRLVHALIGALLAVDAWCAARRQRAEDLRALAQMSDYELRDLGLHRLDAMSGGALLESQHREMR